MRARGAASVKVTYSLPAELVAQVRAVVRDGAVPSSSAFVARALDAALRHERERMLEEELTLAANDPAFLRDVAEVEKDFAAADTETARMIP